MHDNVLVFGGGILQLSLIRKIKKAGFRSIVIDFDNNAPGKFIADVFKVVRKDEFKEAKRIAIDFDIKGIITTATDKPLVVMAKLASELKLPFLSEKAALIGTDKFLMKQLLMINNLPCAKYVYCNSQSFDLNESQIPFDFPAIIKPIDNSGSRGVFYCENFNTLRHYYSASMEFSKKKGLLVEEFLDGEEISVEGYVQDRKFYLVQLTDKLVSDLPYRVETGHIQPASLGLVQKEYINNLLKKVVEICEFNNCGIHAEIKITSKGIKIIEVSPRLGGDFITSVLTENSTDCDIESELIKICLGLNPQKQIKNSGNYCLVKFLQPPHGVVTECAKWTNIEMPKSVIDYQINISAGDFIKIPENSLERVGHLILKGKEKQSLLNQSDEIHGKITKLIQY